MDYTYFRIVFLHLNMPPFPVISSTLSPTGIAEFVHKNYSLSPNTTCRLLKTGINHTYSIDNEGEKFVFRVYCYNWRTQEEILEELNLLELLKANGIRVSFPIKDTSQAYIQTLQAPEGIRFAVLFSYAPGHKIHNYSRESHFEVGKLMAQIHRLTTGLTQKRVTYSTDSLLTKPLATISQFLPDETEEMQFLRSTKVVLENKLLHADHKALRKGIVHLDIWFDNLNISEQNDITLFDFDFCGNGWLCLDIAYYVMQLHTIEKDESERALKLTAFYEGYEHVEKISDEERRFIPALGVCLYYFYLGTQCQRFDNWSNTFLNEVYLKRFTTVLIKSYYEASKESEQAIL